MAVNCSFNNTGKQNKSDTSVEFVDIYDGLFNNDGRYEENMSKVRDLLKAHIDEKKNGILKAQTNTAMQLVS